VFGALSSGGRLKRSVTVKILSNQLPFFGEERSYATVGTIFGQ
jgi:hypothetical protein